MSDKFFPVDKGNKNYHDDIYKILQQYAVEEGRLLEINSGDGELGVAIARRLPKLHWVCSDDQPQHKRIKESLIEEKLSNAHGPEKLKVGRDDFPGKRPFDYVFSDHTLHFLTWKENKAFFKLLGKRLREPALVFFYGPFNYEGKFESVSHEEYDISLKKYNPLSGIRSAEDVEGGMNKNGFKLLKDHKMFDGNHLLVFERLAH